MKNKKHILFVSLNRFPDGDAGAIREIELSKAFSKDTYEVSFITMGNQDIMKWNSYQDYSHISLDEPSSGFIRKVYKKLTYKKKLKKILMEYIKNNKISSIIVYDIPLPSWTFMKGFCKENNITLYYNSTEWYSACEYKHGRLARPFIINTIVNKYVINSKIKVIAISKYLNDYFKSKKIRSVFIPPLVDTESISYFKNFDKYINFMYAGLPGGKGKEDLKNIVDAFSLLNKEDLSKVAFSIIGVNKEQLINNFDVSNSVIEQLGSHLQIMGRVPRKEVLKVYEKCSYSVLLRSDTERYAKASFPSKFVESFATGTAVISNYTCNIEDYIEEGLNGYIVEENSSAALAKVLHKVIQNNVDKEKLCENSRKTALQFFEVSVYKDIVEKFFYE